MPQYQVIDAAPDPLARAAGNFGRGFSGRILQDRKNEKESDVLQEIFKDVDADSDPNDVIRKIYAARGLDFEQKGKVAHSISEITDKARKIRQEQIAEERKGVTRNKLLKAGLPEPLADLYSEATTGGQTEIFKYLRDYAERGGEDYLETLLKQTKENENPIGIENSVPKIENEKEPRNVEKIKDFDKGLTPKERVQRQDKRYAIAAPFVEDLSKQLSAGQRETKALANLSKLNETEDLGKRIWNINPFTGDLLVPALATPAQQLYQKTVNDFISRAKEFFGSRVTNFDLERFMARLPTLGNSAEGRAAILKEMSYAQELMNIEHQALQDVLSEYGPRNIDIPDAERIARKRTEKDRERIDRQIGDLEKVLNKDEQTQIDQYKKKAPSGHILMKTEKGELKYFPKKNVKRLQEKGYTVL
jgi:hypothetical protein